MTLKVHPSRPRTKYPLLSSDLPSSLSLDLSLRPLSHGSPPCAQSEVNRRSILPANPPRRLSPAPWHLPGTSRHSQRPASVPYAGMMWGRGRPCATCHASTGVLPSARRGIGFRVGAYSGLKSTTKDGYPRALFSSMAVLQLWAYIHNLEVPPYISCPMLTPTLCYST